MTLRILYVDTETVWRGGQEQLFGLMEGLKRRGHDIWLASPEGSPLSEKACRVGVSTVPFRQRSEVSPLAIIRLLQIVRKQNFDLLHLNTPRSVIAGGLVGKLKYVKGVLNSRRVNFPLRTRFSRLKYNWLIDRILTVSSSIQETLVHAGVRPELVETIYEGVSLSWIDGLERPVIEPRASGQVVGIVAHLSGEKGHKDLLHAASILYPRFPNVEYWLVGDGPLRPELERLANNLGLQNSVRFLGFRNDSEALMKHFDIFCLPSLSEGLSSAILAAMASHLPVVSTEVGGIPELVIEEKTGYLVKPADSQDLAHALGRLLGDRELQIQFGKAGRNRIAQHFTVVRKLDATEASYSRLLRVKSLR
ncbi:MAG: glycosyltransferase [Acidobacteriota bacterium]|nr:MAG: glycosyltransferase [Acidobacteriota bacterium]